MKARARRSLLAAPFAALIVFASAPARADVTKDQCVDANGEAQDLRREGKLSVAREKLRLCANAACPAIVRDDCTKRLDELERAQPTIAFEVKDASGADVSAVKVTVDGKALTDRLDGTALRVDVGQHVFTFDVAGQAAVTRTLVVTEGEKGRREVLAIGAATAAARASVPPVTPPAKRDVPAPAAAAGPSETESSSTIGGMGPQKIVGLVGMGAGAAGLAVGGVFGMLTLSEKSQQQTDCASSTSCTNRRVALGDHATGMDDSTISTVGFIAGGALLLGGAVLFFTAGHAPEERPFTGLLVVPSAGPAGGGLSLRGEF
jgi:hypothetical protein